MKWTDEKLRELVLDDRVHRDIYTDPEIFELEMQKLFGRLWVFVGHESQVKSRGDYYCTTMARQPVVLTRAADGKIHVVFNRCGHRGAKVVNTESGNTKSFQCCYHGWTFNLDGSLSGIPLQEDYPAQIDFTDPKLGMAPVPRIASYRGFVFGSLAVDGISLEEFLGPAKSSIDDMVDRSPRGEIEFAGGVHRYEFRGNWKHQFENLADTYHPTATHASTVGADGLQFQRKFGSKGGRAPFYDASGNPLVPLIGVWAYPNGHTSEGTMFHVEKEGNAAMEEYRKMMIDRYGKERAAELLDSSRHSVTIFPTVDMLLVQNSIRVVIPIAVDRTEVRVFPVRMVGAPEELFHEIVRYVNITHSAASFVQTDDLESFQRVQQGLATDGNPWCLTARGHGGEKRDKDGVQWGDRSSEIGQRNQHDAWLSFMTA